MKSRNDRYCERQGGLLFRREGGGTLGQQVVKLATSPPGPVKIAQKQAEVNNRTGKILIRDMQTGRFSSKG